MTATLVHTTQDAIARHFAPGDDGFWYPRAEGIALVRVAVDHMHCQVQRRRRPETPWLPIATMRVEEFDPSAFNVWCESWVLVHPLA